MKYSRADALLGSVWNDVLVPDADGMTISAELPESPFAIAR
jgi:hypothetical protein